MRAGHLSRSLRTSVSTLAIAAGFALSAGTASAQTAAPPPPRTDQVEMVVVTAERRATDVQTTPISVSVLSTEDLQKKSVNTLERLMFSTPSLTFNNFGQGDEFNIRGLGKGENNVQTPSGVTTYINGVAVAGGFFQDFPFYDLGSVEVLRGPQGTFAGENATGGAVFITTAKPDFDGVNGYAQVQGGNYSDFGFQGAVNMPVSDDFAIRVSALTERRDSFWSVSGPHTGNPGSLLQYAGRVELLWQPTQSFQAFFYTEYADIDRGGFPADPATSSCVTVPTPSCVRVTTDPFKVSNDVDNQGMEFGYRNVLDLKYTFEDGIALRSITGYAAGGGAERVDLDGTAIPAFHGFLFHDHGEEKIFSEEVNLLSPTTGPFTWILGGYFQHDHVDLPPGNGFDIGVPAGTVDVVLQYHTPKQHEAVFGQATYDITPALQVQLGLRYNHSTFDLESNQQTLFLASLPLASYLAPCPATIPAGLVCSNEVHQSDSAVTGKLDLNYKLDADNFLYAFIATGHKDGALNTTPDINGPDNPPGVIRPERLVDYETGWKSNLFDNHLRTTLDAFYNDYHDFQVTLATSPGQSAILNTRTATIYGFEAQGDAVFGQLSFDFAASYVHGVFGSDVVTDPRFFDTANISGHQMVYSPHFTFDVGAQYEFQLGNGDTLTPRFDYAFVDTQTTSIFDVPGLDQLGVRNILNVQLTYAFEDSWEATAYMTNAADDHYIAAFSAGAPISSNLRNAGPPRQFGIRLTKSF